MEWSLLDEQAMEQVLLLAGQGRETAAPNPMVGALLVHDDEVVGQAYHRAAGESHAEILALEQAGPRARGATLYINLEPCCHQGRTPPCAPQLVAAGVAQVVVGMLDPDPRVSGQSVAFLRSQGLLVRGCPDLWVERCLEINRHFVQSILTQRPFVTLKYAMTLDGRVATQVGDSRWITGTEARQEVHVERSLHQAILVGSGTVLSDDPHLNVRGVPGARQPIRVIVDRRGRMSPKSRVFNSPGAAIWIGYGDLAEEAWKDQIRASGGELFLANNLQQLLEHLHQQGVRSLFLEGGPQLAGAFLDESLVQRVLVYVAPLMVGGAQALGPIAGRGVSLLKDAPRLSRTRWASLGDDLVLEGELDSQWRTWKARCL